MIKHDVIQGSQEWHELRLCKITSTRLKAAISDKRLELMDELIAEMEVGYGDSSDFTSLSMQWGLDYEPLGVTQYEKERGVTVDRVGFIQSSEMPLLGCSPDGLIGETGAIEVKCPDTKKHIKTIRQKQIPNEHKEQVWMYFLVNPKLEWLDFISYDPRLIKRPLFIHRVTREELKKKLDTCWTQLKKFEAKLNELQSEIFF